MIRFTDASLLALTKLRTRRIRLGIVVLLASLLFGLLFGVSLVVQGLFESVEKFSNEAFGNRYIIQAYNQSMPVDPSSAEVLRRAEILQKETIAKKKAEAKRLGLTYDEKAERTYYFEIDTPSGKTKQLDQSSPVARQAMAEYLTEHPGPGLPELKKMAEPFGAIAFFQQIGQNTVNDQGASLQVLKDGNESYQPKQNFTPLSTGIDSFTASWALLSDELLLPFLLPGASIKPDAEGRLPVVAPYTAVEQLLGLGQLPSNASPEAKFERLKQVREGAKNLTFQVCHRNSTSNERVQSALTVKEELERNKNTKDYVKPTLIYGIPSAPCADVTVTRDVRTAEEKAAATKQDQFDQIFGKPASAQTILNFRVVGIAPDPMGGFSTGVADLLRLFAGSSLGQASWISPVSIKETQPLFATLFAPNSLSFDPIASSVFAEFPNAESAKKFIEAKECKVDVVSIQGGPTKDPFAECAANNKLFGLSPFGSNSLALSSLKSSFQRYFTMVALGVAAIAALIMMGLVGRMISDSRRETAVFRAIGAKRIDIVAIYLIYLAACIVLIIFFAALIGLLASQYVVDKQQANFTLQALLIFNAQDLDTAFSLRALNLSDALRLAATIVAAGLLSSVIPLLRNVQRNPIRDMRDDT